MLKASLAATQPILFKAEFACCWRNEGLSCQTFCFSVDWSERFSPVQAEWIDLLEEDRSGRVRWENPKLAASLRVTSTGRKGRPPPIVRDALNGDPAPQGETAIGWRIAVWWRDDACYYKGTIEHYNAEAGN